MNVRVTVGLLVAVLLSLTGLAGVSAPVAADPSQHKIVFPIAGEDMAGLRWSDTWGAPRSGGRSHIGVDMLGTKMMRMVAVGDTTVVWGRFDNGRGSIVRLRDADGWEYQYIHVNNDTPGTDDGRANCSQALAAKLCAARDGSKLTKGIEFSAGEFIGYLGDSGNAEWTTPHLHFEIYRPDGAAVNPTPYVDDAVDRIVFLDAEPEPEPQTEKEPEPKEEVGEEVEEQVEEEAEEEEVVVERASPSERQAARDALEADPSTAATEVSVRLNGRAATEAEHQAMAETIETEGAEQAIAEMVDTNPAVAMVDRLYLTFFQRHPDAEGLDYWLETVGDGAELEEVAEWFAMSGEFQRRYAGQDFSQFLDQLYVDVLDRTPDEQGKAYWLEQLEDGTVTRGTIVVYFTEGEELVRNHQLRTELTVAYRALGLNRPTAQELASWAESRKNLTLAEALQVWLNE